MDLTPHTLGEYCALLEPQLAAPLPEGLDLSQSGRPGVLRQPGGGPRHSLSVQGRPLQGGLSVPRPPSGARWPM